MVPLVGVLYALALISFAVAGYYGFRLTRVARRMKVMVMISREGPEWIVQGIVLLAASQVINFLNVLVASPIEDYFVVASVTLLVGSAIMFAFGLHTIYFVYINEKMRMSVASAFSGLFEKQIDEQAKWRGELR